MSRSVFYKIMKWGINLNKNGKKYFFQRYKTIPSSIQQERIWKTDLLILLSVASRYGIISIDAVFLAGSKFDPPNDFFCTAIFISFHDYHLAENFIYMHKHTKNIFYCCVLDSLIYIWIDLYMHVKRGKFCLQRKNMYFEKLSKT